MRVPVWACRDTEDEEKRVSRSPRDYSNSEGVFKPIGRSSRCRKRQEVGDGIVRKIRAGSAISLQREVWPRIAGRAR